jgi:hypothetical protein
MTQKSCRAFASQDADRRSCNFCTAMQIAWHACSMQHAEIMQTSPGQLKVDISLVSEHDSMFEAAWYFYSMKGRRGTACGNNAEILQQLYSCTACSGSTTCGQWSKVAQICDRCAESS